MATRMTEAETRIRREQIVHAARWCFLNVGYARTSLKAIADRADLSRPLLYLAFPNKAALCVAVLEEGFDARCQAAQAVAESKLGCRERLMRVCELLLLEPWADLAKAPCALEFFQVCGELAPKLEERQRRRVVKCLQGLLGSREVSDVFLLALEGVESDLPSNAVLRRRVEVLVERFAN